MHSMHPNAIPHAKPLERPASRVVLTLAVGKQKHAECALGLGRSLKLIGDSTYRVVITDQLDHPWDRSFDLVLPPTEPLERVYLSKLSGLERTSAQQVLFIDSDCLVFKRLDAIFDYCQGRGLCVQGKTIEEGNWYGDVRTRLEKHGLSAMPYFNGGMIYYERTSACEALIESCRDLGSRPEESGVDWKKPGVPEEPYLSLAMAKWGPDREFGCHLIPNEMDFHQSAANILGELELDVRKNLCRFILWEGRLAQPTILHCWKHINYAAYWKQLDALREIEEYPLQHKFGYLTPGQKFERYLNKRYLRYIRRKR